MTERDRLKDRFWSNLDTSIEAYSEAIDRLLDIVSLSALESLIPEPGKVNFHVFYEGDFPRTSKMDVTRSILSVMPLGLIEARALLESACSPQGHAVTNVRPDTAHQFASVFQDAGFTVTITPA